MRGAAPGQPAGYRDSGTYQPIIPNCMPSSYPSGRFSLIALRTALSAARRSAGSAARYWATVEAVMLATILTELCGGQASCTAPLLYRAGELNQRAARDSNWRLDLVLYRIADGIIGMMVRSARHTGIEGVVSVGFMRTGLAKIPKISIKEYAGSRT